MTSQWSLVNLSSHAAGGYQIKCNTYSGLWMRLIKNLLQFVNTIVCINLGGSQTTMSEEVLYGIYFSAFI